MFVRGLLLFNVFYCVAVKCTCIRESKCSNNVIEIGSDYLLIVVFSAGKASTDLTCGAVVNLHYHFLSVWLLKWREKGLQVCAITLCHVVMESGLTEFLSFCVRIEPQSYRNPSYWLTPAHTHAPS